MRFDDFYREHRAFAARHEALRRSSAADRDARLDELAAARRTLTARAATWLPKRGDETDAVIRALRGDDDEARAFVLHVLAQRKQFPRIYLDAAVEGALRARSDHYLAMLSSAHGAAATLDALTRAVDAGHVQYSRARLHVYYASSGLSGDDRRDVEAAGRLLRQAIWQAYDAPAGARDANEPPPETIVQIVGWRGSGPQRGQFARAVDAAIACGARRAEGLLERTAAHPGAVALELSAARGETIVGALRSTRVELRVVHVTERLSDARRVVREIRDAIGRCASLAEMARVRADLDPFRE